MSMSAWRDMLDHVIDIQYHGTAAQDASGGKVQTWKTVASGVPCAIQTVSVARTRPSETRVQEASHRVYFEGDDLRAAVPGGLTTEHRFAYQDPVRGPRYFTFLGYEDQDFEGTNYTAMAKEFTP